MTRRVLAAITFAALCSVAVAGQQPAPEAPRAPAPRPATAKPPQPPQAPAAPEAPAAPRPPVDPEVGGQPVNIRLEVTINDQVSASASQPRTITMLLADRSLSQVRPSFGDRVIRIDARPTIVDGRIRLRLTVETQMNMNPAKMAEGGLWNWSNSVSVLLESGKPMTVVESSEPSTGRKTTVEVRATIVK